MKNNHEDFSKSFYQLKKFSFKNCILNCPQEGVVVIITSRPVKKTSHVRQLFERGKMQEGYGEKCIFVLTMLLQLLGWWTII